MVRPRLCRAVVAAVMCVGTGALTSGVAHASTTLVFSDTIKFSATLARDGTVHATKCNLTSDAEPVSFVCQATGRVWRWPAVSWWPRSPGSAGTGAAAGPRHPIISTSPRRADE